MIFVLEPVHDHSLWQRLRASRSARTHARTVAHTHARALPRLVNTLLSYLACHDRLCSLSHRTLRDRLALRAQIIW